MFGSVKKHIDNPTSDIETIIGRGTTIKGNLEGSGNIRIDGDIDGDVSVTGNIVIGESGNVQGNIKADSLTVGGTIKGNADCDGNLCIQAKGQLIGDIRARSLNIEEGGIFKGRSEMDTHFGSLTSTFDLGK